MRKEFEVAYAAIMNVVDITKQSFAVQTKDDGTCVTGADVLVEKKLINAIKQAFPNDNFVTEESNSTNQISSTGRTWIIDPIDGTLHYTHDSIFWGIQLAFMDKAETKFSIISLPKLGEVYYAKKGEGVFLNHTKLSLKPPLEFRRCIVEFGGSMHKYYKEKQRILESLIFSEKGSPGIMHINASCISFTNLISGKTDALIISTKKPWDIIPGIFLCEEAGIKEEKIGNLELYTNNSELAKFITA